MSKTVNCHFNVFKKPWDVQFMTLRMHNCWTSMLQFPNFRFEKFLKSFQYSFLSNVMGLAKQQIRSKYCSEIHKNLPIPFVRLCNPVFSQNTGKYGPEKLRIWTLFAQCLLSNSFRSSRPEVFYERFRTSFLKISLTFLKSFRRYEEFLRQYQLFS